VNRGVHEELQERGVFTLETLDINAGKKGLRVRERFEEREMIIVGGVDVRLGRGRVEGVGVKGI
jgi:hypothetical protein